MKYPHNIPFLFLGCHVCFQEGMIFQADLSQKSCFPKSDGWKPPFLAIDWNFCHIIEVYVCHIWPWTYSLILHILSSRQPTEIFGNWWIFQYGCLKRLYRGSPNLIVYLSLFCLLNLLYNILELSPIVWQIQISEILFLLQLSCCINLPSRPPLDPYCWRLKSHEIYIHPASYSKYISIYHLYIISIYIISIYISIYLYISLYISIYLYIYMISHYIDPHVFWWNPPMFALPAPARPWLHVLSHWPPAGRPHDWSPRWPSQWRSSNRSTLDLGDGNVTVPPIMVP